MTAVEIIEEIKHLPRDEQTRVIEFARHAGENRQLSPEELGKLAKKMVKAKDPKEADRLQEEIVGGFYGGKLAMDGIVADTWEKLGPAPDIDYERL